MAKLSVGMYVAYAQGRGTKRVRIGKVVQITKADASIVVSRHRPLADGRLRIRWVPILLRDAYEAESPALETLHPRQIVTICQLHDGVLSHAAARQLDKHGWRLDESDLVQEADLPGPPAEPSVEAFARLEEFCSFSVPPVKTKGGFRSSGPAVAVEFEADEMQVWLVAGVVQFLEVYCGVQELTLRVREAGLSAGEGIDSRVLSYGQLWDLKDRATQLKLAWLICRSLVPLAIHAGTPCTDMSILGKRRVERSAELVELSTFIGLHQEARGFLFSNENPETSLLMTLPVWESAFGPHEAPFRDWKYYRADACQCNMFYPGEGDYGRPMRKCQDWLANFSLEGMALRCRKPEAVAGSSHKHHKVDGSVRFAGKWMSVASYSGRYTPEQCTLYALPPPGA